MDRVQNFHLADNDRVPLCAPSLPVLGRGEWNRKFGRYDFHRFDHLTSGHASVGGATIGKVEVDCKFRFKESKWGSLGGGTPAGIIYMDIDFHQPKDCVLTWATIQVTLEDGGLAPGQTQHFPLAMPVAVASSQYPVQMTPWFGPQHIVGPERIVKTSKKINLTPDVQVVGNGVGGIGAHFESSFDIPHRWKFTGRLVRPDGEACRGGQYKALEWELKENELDPGQSNKVHTAFAFEYGGQPFLMKVKVKGGLKKMHHRIKEKVKSLKFGPRPNEVQDTSTTLVGPYHGRRRPLDALARGLEQAMEMENQKRRGLEMPKPQRATFRETKPTGWDAPSPHADVGCASFEEPLPNSPQRISTQARARVHPLPVIEAQEGSPARRFPVPQSLAEPTLENLARAGRHFARNTVREAIRDDDGSESSWPSSAATLVAESQQTSPSLAAERADPYGGHKLSDESKNAEAVKIQRAVVEKSWMIWVLMTLGIFQEFLVALCRLPGHRLTDKKKAFKSSQ